MSAPGAEPAPSFTKTYKRADKELIGDDYGWVTALDVLDDDEYPTELIEETWERTAVRRFWHLPHPWGWCEVEGGPDEDDDCGTDAVAWKRDGDKWFQVCAEHKPAEVEQ